MYSEEGESMRVLVMDGHAAGFPQCCLFLAKAHIHMKARWMKCGLFCSILPMVFGFFIF